MTTFNLKNQSRKTLYFRYGLLFLIVIGVIAGVLYITKPSLFNKINKNSDNSSKTEINDYKTVPSNSSQTHANMNVADDSDHVVVATNLGKVRGKRSKQIGVEVNSFLGIPYGKPPTGKLRFRRTVAAKPWSGTLNATSLPPACLQSSYTQKLFPVKILNYDLSEDCLYLNIWVPSNASQQQRLPVIVWIHGGMFTIGSIGVDEYDGSVLAAYGNVAVVTIQYRIGIFGFLDLDHDSIPGNMGLSDQAMAIKWISENIGNFGGDPEQITLMGQSAGGISIGLHMMSPITKTLFKRAIIQSGSHMLLNQIYTRGDSVAETFVGKIGCAREGVDIFESQEWVIRCIDRVSLEKINEAQQEMVANNPVPFLPTIPSDYAEWFPTDNEANITYAQHDLLVGFNLNEGNLILHLAYPDRYTRTSVPDITTLEEARDALTSMAIDGGFPETQAKSMASVLLQGNGSDTAENWARKMGTVFGDIMFACPSIKFADKFSNLNKSVHMYVFTQRAQNSVWGNWLGVTHHDEIDFMFGVPLRYPNKFHGDDINLSKRMVKTWAEFARSGSVSPNEYQHEWPLYDAYNKSYLELNARNANIGHRFHEQSCNLYDALVEYLS